MLTQNGRNAIAGQIAAVASGGNPGRLPIVDRTGSTFYYVGRSSGSGRSWPANQTQALTFGLLDGIVVGSGNAPATLSDYDLDDQITTGLTGAVTVSTGIDTSGNIYLNFDIVFTNTSNADITIREIGISDVIYCATSAGDTSPSSKHALVDRTILETPVTIAAGDNETIRYRITPAW